MKLNKNFFLFSFLFIISCKHKDRLTLVDENFDTDFRTILNNPNDSICYNSSENKCFKLSDFKKSLSLYDTSFRNAGSSWPEMSIGEKHFEINVRAAPNPINEITFSYSYILHPETDTFRYINIYYDSSNGNPIKYEMKSVESEYAKSSDVETISVISGMNFDFKENSILRYTWRDGDTTFKEKSIINKENETLQRRYLFSVEMRKYPLAFLPLVDRSFRK